MPATLYANLALSFQEPLVEPRHAMTLKLQRTVFQNDSSYFHHYKDLDAEQARDVALDIWRDINLRNLNDNILPSRERANVVLRKRADHLIGEVWLRQI